MSNIENKKHFDSIVNTTFGINENTFDVVVVGAGIAGLTAAIYLAKDGGLSVCILEQSSVVGGRARTSVIDGFYLNLGPHALYLGGAGVKILKQLGVKFTGNPPPTPTFLVKDRKLYPQIGSLYSVLSTKLLKDINGRFETIKFFISLKKMNFGKFDNVPLDHWLKENVKSKELTELIKTFCRVATYSTDFSSMSAGAALNQLQLAASIGVLYLDEGWQTLVNGLMDEAKKNQVRIVTGKRVMGIKQNEFKKIDDKSKPHNFDLLWNVMLSNNESIDASNVILAVEPTTVNEILKYNYSYNFKSSVNKTIFPVKATCLDVVLNKLPKPKQPVAFGIDTPLYLSAHSISANLVSKKNEGQLIHLLKYQSNFEESDPKKDRIELENFLDLVQPGWKDEVIKERYMPNMIVYNSLVMASEGGLKGRTKCKLKNTNGLYIIGDWIGAEGMLVDASFASAKQAAMEIINDKINTNPLQQQVL